MSLSHSSTSTSAPTSRLRALVRTLLHYIEARGELLQIEAREAGSKSIFLVVAIVIALTALIFGWLMALPALVWIIAHKGGWHWSEVSLVGAAIHLVVCILGLLVFKIKLRQFRVFEDSIRELGKDRDWLTSESDQPPA